MQANNVNFTEKQLNYLKMKSVIICDMEGIILKMNKGAADMFGYNPNELIGNKRVSLFSPGEIVLQNVLGWLEKADKDGENTIKTNRPILLVEIEKRHSQRNVEDSITIIKKFGYKCYFVKNKELISSDKLENKDLENNYFFLPE